MNKKAYSQTILLLVIMTLVLTSVSLAGFASTNKQTNLKIIDAKILEAVNLEAEQIQFFNTQLLEKTIKNNKDILITDNKIDLEKLKTSLISEIENIYSTDLVFKKFKEQITFETFSVSQEENLVSLQLEEIFIKKDIEKKGKTIIEVIYRPKIKSTIDINNFA